MKIIFKLLSGAVVGAALMCATTDAHAGSYVSFGFGYRGGHRQHWGAGYSVAYCPPPVYYGPPRTVVYAPPPPPVYTPAPPSRAPAPADIKALAKAGLSDEVIISQIRNSRAVYRLTTAEIIDLTESGVSQRVIDFMINTPRS